MRTETGLRIPPIGCHLRGDNNLLRKRNDSTNCFKTDCPTLHASVCAEEPPVLGEEYEVLHIKSPNLCDIGCGTCYPHKCRNTDKSVRSAELHTVMKPSLLPFQLSRQKQIVAADRNFSRYK
jgi:hypothetical protein